MVDLSTSSEKSRNLNKIVLVPKRKEARIRSFEFSTEMRLLARNLGFENHLIELGLILKESHVPVPPEGKGLTNDDWVHYVGFDDEPSATRFFEVINATEGLRYKAELPPPCPLYYLGSRA